MEKYALLLLALSCSVVPAQMPVEPKVAITEDSRKELIIEGLRLSVIAHFKGGHLGDIWNRNTTYINVIRDYDHYSIFIRISKKQSDSLADQLCSKIRKIIVDKKISYFVESTAVFDSSKDSWLLGLHVPIEQFKKLVKDARESLSKL